MAQRDGRHDIAIIGAGAVLPPDGAGVSSFLDLIETGGDAIIDVPQDRWVHDDHYDADASVPDKSYARIGGFVQNAPFKSFEFRIPPKVADSIDRVQKWALMATREALAQAGLTSSGSTQPEFNRERTAVLFGNSMGGEQVYRTAIRVHMNTVKRQIVDVPAFQQLDSAVRQQLLESIDESLRADLPPITEDSMAGELANCIAGRVASAFDLRGPSCSIDAACAGSLAAIHTAVHGLRAKSYDLAVVGGVDSNMGPESYVKFCKIGALSPDGSRPFDHGANGFVMGEGAAVFVLKRLEDALKDSDKVLAVIRGVGASSDGKGKGITAPNPRGQAQALRKAYSDAGLRPRDVSYVECHGTSTPVGDGVEVGCLKELFAEDGVPDASIPVGSVKSQIGHLKGAAGAAGMLKVVLSLMNKKRYPSINVSVPNPAVFADGALRVQTMAEPWDNPPNNVRRAGVSAFGFGGTNYHVLIEEGGAIGLKDLQHPAAAPASAPAEPAEESWGVAIVGAATRDELVGRLDQLATGGDADAVAGAADHRVAVVGQGAARDGLIALAKKSLPSANDKILSALSMRGVHYGQGKPGKVAFVFPGQGSQYPGMMRELYNRCPEVKRTLDEADEVMTPLLGHKLTDVMFGDDAEALKKTEITQPALLASDTALMRSLMAAGIQPDGAIGHSLGEYAALVCSGALSFADALTAVSARGREMSRVTVEDPGKMASVFAPSHVIERALEPITAAGGYVVCANRNSSSQTVIAGASASVDQACAALDAEGVKVVKLPVSMAFHTDIVAPAVEPLKRVLQRLDRKAPRIPVYKNIDGRPYPMGAGAADELVDILGRQVGSPVEFVKSLEQMWADGFTHFVEVGPRRVLTTFVTDVLGGRGAVALPTNIRKKGDIASFSAAIAALRAAGVRPQRPAAVKMRPKTERIVVTGASLGLPNRRGDVFDELNLDKLFDGHTFISDLPQDDVDGMVAQNVVRVKKDASGGGSFELLDNRDDAVHLVGRAGRMDLVEDFGLDERMVESFDQNTRLGVAAGLQALHDAYLPLVRTWRKTTTGGRLPTGWALPEEVGNETGVIFASAFAGMNAVVEELKAKQEQGDEYRYPRNFLLRVIVTAHAQLAQLIKAKGPNTQLTTACASTTTAMALAQDWIRAGRCRRVVVIGADDITSSNMADWFVTGFLAAGAATNEKLVENAALPFDRRRHGMIVGMGAVGMVLESAEAAEERGVTPIVELVGTQVANSAFHGTRLDTEHVAQTMCTLVDRSTRELGISSEELSSDLIFMSHETHTPARGGSAQAEVDALRAAFGSGADDVLVANTKGFTGHPMGAGLEDAVVLKALQYGKVPPIANLKEPDPDLMPLNLSAGGTHERRYALRLAAGFGSQIGMSLLKKVAHGDDRIADLSTLQAWLTRYGAKNRPQLEVVNRTLRIAEEELPTGAEFVLPHGPHRVAMEAPPVVEETPAAVVVATSFEQVRDVVLGIVSNRTGFPTELLQLDMDLEADLGIDTIKQGDILSETRLVFGLPVEREIQLKDYPTLRYAIERVCELTGVTAPAAAAPAPQTATASADVAERVIALVASRTGYPAEMLELDLDMEADLGIDTVKQAEILAELRETFGLPEDQELTLKDTPTLRHVIEYLSGNAAPVAVPVPVAAPVVVAAEDRTEAVVALVANRTGYPAEMLELDLDMEADLGIDTVKQAEILAELRENFGLPEDTELKLKDYPTLRHVADYVNSQGGGAKPAPAPVAAPVTPAPVAPVPVAAAAADTRNLEERVVNLVASRTGYPAEMLELDLDMEADLGIDTVKQAEILAELREEFALPENQELQLSEYPTLRHVIGYVSSRAPSEQPTLKVEENIAAALEAAPKVVVPWPVTQSAPTPVSPAPVASTANLEADVVALVADRTGYPAEMLELDLDMEADRGIATVTQAELMAELRERFALPESQEIQLKDYPTLRHVIAYVGQHSATASTPAAAPEPVAAAAVAPVSAPVSADVEATVVGLVAERTGYPVEMLELDLDMEADLGIDTVKQAELLAELRETFGVAAEDGLQLKDYPTLRHVVNFMQSKSSPAPAAAPVAEAAPPRHTLPARAGTGGPVLPTPPIAPPTGDPLTLVRGALAKVCGMPPSSLSIHLRPGPDLGVQLSDVFPGFDLPADASVADIVAVLSDDTGAKAPTPAPIVAPIAVSKPAAASVLDADMTGVQLRRLAWRLRGNGARYGATGVEPKSGDTVVVMGDDAQVAELVAKAVRSTGATAMVVPIPGEASELPAARGLIYLGGSSIGLFRAAKGMAGTLQSGGFVLAIGGRELAGFCKSLSLEWSDAALVKAVVTDVTATAELATLVMDELAYDGETRVVRWAGGARWVEGLQVVELPEPAEGRAESATWVVSGGARGITAEIVRQVATQRGGCFHLLGRTALQTPLPTALPDDEAAARKVVLDELKAAGKKPVPTAVLAEVKRRRGQREIAAFIQSLEALPGVTATYHAADVADASALKKALGHLKRVDYLVHAAGIEVSKTIDRKTDDEFAYVTSPKLIGLESLLSALDGAHLDTIVTFGSVSGRFGNFGQTDYAAANEGMADRLTQLSQRTLQIDWTAWSGVGMATRGSVTKMLEAAGIGFLPPEQGVTAFRRLVLGGAQGEIVVDKGLGQMEPAAYEPSLPTAPTFFGEGAVVTVEGQELAFAWPLDAGARWLDDHRIDGVAVLPGVMGLEAFSQASLALVSGARVSGFEGVAFKVPLKLFGDRPVTASVRVQAMAPQRDEGTRLRCRLVSRHVSKAGVPQGPERLHFTATVVLADSVSVTQPVRPNGEPMRGNEAGDIYDRLFHGQSFQVLSAAERYDGGLRAAVNGDRLRAPATDPASAPMELEALFQAVGLMQVMDDGSMGLPSTASTVTIYGAPARQRPLECFVTRADGNFEALLRDEKGRVYLELSGYETATLPS